MSNTHHAHHVLVPVKPTPEMLLAGHHKIDWCRDGQKTNVMEDPSQVEVISGQTIGTTCKQDLADAWEAMLAAAPAPSSLAGGEVLSAGERAFTAWGATSGADGTSLMWTWGEMPASQQERWAKIALAALSPEAPAREEATGAKAVVRNGQIVISIDVDALPLILSGSIALNAVAGTFKVTDAAAFAKEVCHALNDEKEDGTTRVHMMFDSAFNHAIGQGGEGVEEISEDEFEAEASRLQEEARRPTPEPDALPVAINDIAAERQRQIDAEGRTPEADDGYRNGELAAAASAYAFSAATRTRYLALDPLGFWPWAPEWFKPKDQRSDLVRAGALIVAEIERFDRAQLTADDDNGEADCPICKVQFKADDLCLTDIDLGPCHAECLADSPAVDLDSDELLPEGAPPPTPYRYDMTRPADASNGADQ